MGSPDIQVSSIMSRKSKLNTEIDETIDNNLHKTNVDYERDERRNEIKKDIIRIFRLLSILLLSVALAILVTYKYTFNKIFPKSLTHEFDDRIEEIKEESVYDFMPVEMSDYICEMCLNLGIDPDLSVSILLNENPTFNVDALHRNENGTIDVGLWQLNDRYLWTTFKDAYWKFDKVDKNDTNYIDLDPFNWKHNTYIALHHIQDLSKSLKYQDDIIMAYNAGIGRVMSGDIPVSTYGYLNKAKINYELLTNRCKPNLEIN